MSDYSMADISSLVKSIGANNKAINSTSRENNIDLDMTDFLQLMIVQLQSQTLDDTMDTSEMMNQMVQMQMISAITNMTETNIMSYASSLVGKEVTIGILNGDTLEERVVTVTGTAMSNGQQVIFGTDEKGNTEAYALNQIMAIGRLPEIDEDGNIVNNPGTGTTVPPTQPTQPDTTTPDDNGGDVDNSVNNPDTGTGSTDNTENAGDNGADSTVTPPDPSEEPVG